MPYEWEEKYGSDDESSGKLRIVVGAIQSTYAMQRSKKIFSSLKNSVAKAALVRRITNLENEVAELKKLLIAPAEKRKISEKNFFCFPNQDLDVRITRCPNLDSLDFHTSRPLDISRELVGGKRIGIKIEAGDATEQEMAYFSAIFAIGQIETIYLEPYCFQICKAGAAEWANLIPKILEVLPTLFKKELVAGHAI